MEAPRQKLINESATVVATTTFGDVTLNVFFSAIIVKLKIGVRDGLGRYPAISRSTVLLRSYVDASQGGELGGHDRGVARDCYRLKLICTRRVSTSTQIKIDIVYLLISWRSWTLMVFRGSGTDRRLGIKAGPDI